MLLGDLLSQTGLQTAAGLLAGPCATDRWNLVEGMDLSHSGCVSRVERSGTAPCPLLGQDAPSGQWGQRLSPGELGAMRVARGSQPGTSCQVAMPPLWGPWFSVSSGLQGADQGVEGLPRCFPAGHHCCLSSWCHEWGAQAWLPSRWALGLSCGALHAFQQGLGVVPEEHSCPSMWWSVCPPRGLSAGS